MVSDKDVGTSREKGDTLREKVRRDESDAGEKVIDGLVHGGCQRDGVWWWAELR